MDENTKIKYTFHNKHGETVNMTFKMIEIEGMIGGFVKNVSKELDEIGFGGVEKIERKLLD